MTPGVCTKRDIVQTPGVEEQTPGEDFNPGRRFTTPGVWFMTPGVCTARCSASSRS